MHHFTKNQKLKTMNRYTVFTILIMLITYHIPAHAVTDFPEKHAEFAKCEWVSPNGGTLLYRQYSPEVVEGEKYPLIVFLHGAGERGNDNEAQLVHDEWMTFLFGKDGRKAYAVAPQCPADEKWVNVSWAKAETHETPEQPSDSLRMTREVVENMKKTLPVDETRIYITGLSMGGYGTFDYMIRWGDEIAAAIPLCGGADNAKLKETESLRTLGIWIFHGDQDGAVPVQRSRLAAAALKEINPKTRYTEMEGVGHDIWTPAYRHEELAKWLLEQQSVRQLAIQKFNEIRGIDDHLRHDITVKEEAEEWIVFFERNPRVLGGHADVTISKKTGEIQYFPGK